MTSMGPVLVPLMNPNKTSTANKKPEDATPGLTEC